MNNNNTSEQDKEFIIPIDGYIEDFKTHLESHPRTIFSAKFGDGKSYFLNKIQESEAFKDYTFLTIHPVNYQVESNKDIFELIKRDILLKMTANNMIDKGYEIPDSIAIQFFLQNNVSTVAEFFISSLSQINADNELYSSIVTGYKGFEFVQKLKAKLQEYKKRGSDEEYMEKFFDATDNITSVENDAISRIISHNIRKYQEEQHKKVVLIFEDMDRIDPAHLFRIMNVLSAQMDLPYISNENPNEDLNKYGFDNIVLVLHYDNLKSIFKHFYGLDTSFDGYISKFSPRGHFDYSLKEIRRNYIYEILTKVTDFSKEKIQNYISNEFIDKLDLRKIKEALIDVDKQILNKAIVEEDGLKIISSYNMLKFTIIMLRLGVHKNQIIESTEYQFNKYQMFLAYFNSYFLEKKVPVGNNVYVKSNRYKNTYFTIKYRGIRKEDNSTEGLADVYISTSNLPNNSIEFTTFKQIAESIFDYISQ